MRHRTASVRFSLRCTQVCVFGCVVGKEVARVMVEKDATGRFGISITGGPRNYLSIILSVYLNIDSTICVFRSLFVSPSMPACLPGWLGCLPYSGEA